MSSTIHSVCIRPQHRTIHPGHYTLTVHDGQWAYCPEGAEGEHDWEPIEPVDLDALMRSVRAAAAQSPEAA
jgi:hypothetical protein